MTPCVLIFYPEKPGFIGLWQPHSAESWQTVSVSTGLADATNTLLDALTQLLTQEKIDLAAVTHIGVMAGPASYTQLRSFVAVANALAWARDIPLFAFPSTALLPAAIPELLLQAHRRKPIEPVYPHPIDEKK